MKSLWYILIFLSFALLYPSCSDNLIVEGPEIQWVSGGNSISYSYSSGVVSGYRLYRSFKVLDESGEIEINVQVKGENATQFSESFQVENGKTYRIAVKASRSGSFSVSPGESCLNVEFSSPNVKDSEQIRIPNYLVSAGGIDNYYCPETLVFKEITLE